MVKAEASAIRNELFQLVVPIGRLRYANYMSWNTSLFARDRQWDVCKYINEDLWVINVDKLIDDFFASMPTQLVPCPTTDEIRRILNTNIPCPDESTEVCNGHDLVSVLYLLLAKKHKCKPMPGLVEYNRLMVACFGMEELRKTRMYCEIKKWERQNQPYTLLPHTNDPCGHFDDSLCHRPANHTGLAC